MHRLEEAHATPLKVAIAVKSRAMAPAGVMKRVDPEAKPTRFSASIKEQIRMTRVHVFIFAW
jgi:hypothetical protein